MHAVLLANGDLKINKRIENIIEMADLVIAADGGARHAIALKCEIDFWMGDFDSSSLDLQRKFEKTEKKFYSPNKNQLDIELCIEKAKELGAKRATILGAFGGRFDHTFALAAIAIAQAQKGFLINLDSGFERGYPLTSSTNLDLELSEKQVFSILPFANINGLTIKGAKWPLENADLAFGNGLCISNEALGPVHLNLQEGLALIITQN